ncbi:Uncharacterised protein [Vibrio cholerae]|nr:Uncharacterised protein [Vibrio cholerae]
MRRLTRNNWLAIGITSQNRRSIPFQCTPQQGHFRHFLLSKRKPAACFCAEIAFQIQIDWAVQQ